MPPSSGIKVESADAAHQGWIELTSAQGGVKQPKSATASTAGGHPAEPSGVANCSV
jgi:type VI secretion system secreted protein Hcp